VTVSSPRVGGGGRGRTHKACAAASNGNLRKRVGQKEETNPERSFQAVLQGKREEGGVGCTRLMGRQRENLDLRHPEQ